MKLDRLLSILVLLMRKDRVRARELAEMFDVSVRTILRDIETINLAGIPIVTYQGANGGIGIAEGYRIDKNILTTDDMASIITSLRGISGALPGNTHEILLAKMKSVMSPYQRDLVDAKANRIVVDPSPWGSEKPEVKELMHEMVETIKKAIDNSNIVEFSYSDTNGNKTKRKAEPYSLILKGRNWYLNGWCLTREDFRLFKLSRVKNLTVSAERFTPREMPLSNDRDLSEEWQKSGKTVTLELVFDKEVETAAEEWLAGDCRRNEAGKLVATVTLPETGWLYGSILSFGPYVEVLDPPHIRTIVANAARDIYGKYSNELQQK
jgi:predicted DNA-binding transcriptional regulator YafY